MTEGPNVYCELCWARILDAGYVDRSELCFACWHDVVGWDELAGDVELDVVLVDRLIV